MSLDDLEEVIPWHDRYCVVMLVADHEEHGVVSFLLLELDDLTCLDDIAIPLTAVVWIWTNEGVRTIWSVD